MSTSALPHPQTSGTVPIRSDSLAVGQPRFADQGLEHIRKQLGAAAAWRESLRRFGSDGAVSRVRGDFAIGLHDECSGRGYAAVDRLGVQTLCFRIVDGRFVFATRADELADAATPIDPQAIYDYLYFHTIPSPRTVFRDVHRLPPGHQVVYEHGQLKVSRYWTPVFDEPEHVRFEHLRDEFNRLLRVAVQRRVYGKAACFLSGGTDSSTVAGLAAEVTNVAPATYSIGFKAEGYDEMAYARLASRRFNTEHHEYYVTPDDLVHGIPRLAAAFDQPFGNSSVLPAYYCASNARNDGVATLLAGDGGDELFGGNARYATQRIFDWYGAVPRFVRAMLEPAIAWPGLCKTRLFRRAAGYIEQAKMPMPGRLELYNLLRRLGPETVLTRKFLDQVDAASPLRQQEEVWCQAKTGSSLNRTLAFDWRYTLAENDLPKVRWATGLAQVAAEFPLLDDDLLEFSLRLPADYKVKGLQLRWFFKESLRGFLPDEIIQKKKHGFGLPFGPWLMSHAPLRELARDSLRQLALRNIVRADFIESLFTNRLAEHPGYYGEMVWILMMLELWLQQHSGGSPAFE